MGSCCSKSGDPSDYDREDKDQLDDAHHVGPRDASRHVIRTSAARGDRWRIQVHDGREDDDDDEALHGDTPPIDTSNHQQRPSPIKDGNRHQQLNNDSNLNEASRRASTSLATQKSRTSSAASTQRIVTPPMPPKLGVPTSGGSLLSGVSPTTAGDDRHPLNFLTTTSTGDATTFHHQSSDRNSERGNDSFSHAAVSSTQHPYHSALLATMITLPSGAVPTKLPPKAPHSRRASEDGGAPTTAASSGALAGSLHRPPPIAIANSSMSMASHPTVTSSSAFAMTTAAPTSGGREPSTDGFELVEDLEESSTPCVGGGGSGHQHRPAYGGVVAGEKLPIALHSPTDIHRQASTRSMRSLNFSATFMMSASDVHGCGGGMAMAGGSSGRFIGGAGGSSSEFVGGDVMPHPPLGASIRGGSSSQRSDATPAHQRPSPSSGPHDLSSQHGTRGNRSPSAAAEVSMTFELLPGSNTQYPLGGSEGLMASSDHLTNSRQSESAAAAIRSSRGNSHRGPAAMRNSASGMRASGFTSVLTNDEHRRALVAAQRQEASTNMMMTSTPRLVGGGGAFPNSSSYGAGLDEMNSFATGGGGGGGMSPRRMDRMRSGGAASPLSVRAAPHRQLGYGGGSMSRQNSFPNLNASAVHLSVAASTQEFGDLVDEADYSTTSTTDSA
ncbi:Hypothetical protein, putative [Bodo saltans]|uniref:Uncharacterized protein n=1 Tax=Bodo saltans TaxID=75058 RepID=A0A0S4JN85_BODSA|nr:Hypothetical protein, putative [Bodo saltans]|eukprot:CUG91881.1 Hypothetical protein, putative [Bodo saltans]